MIFIGYPLLFYPLDIAVSDFKPLDVVLASKGGI
jgi:hypothetical protein